MTTSAARPAEHRERGAKRVRLTCDLTYYRAGLVEGSLGWTTSRNGQWGVIVQYDNGTSLDTMWKSLEVLEPETAQNDRYWLWWDFECEVRRILQDGVPGDELRKRITQLVPIVKREMRDAARKERAAAR